MDARLEQLLAPRYDRVRRHGPEKANEEILREMRERIAWYANRPQDEVEQRLEALEREWDIERVLEAKAASLSLVGLLLGVTVDRKWLWVPGVVAGFLLQHAVSGWCPPVEVFRRLKFRTRKEIDAEKFVLRVQRGDFRGAEIGHSASSEGPGWG
ncbi:YgaP family membrane protein [Archangium lansingense]|uniref:YgaP family membrane protein n=1 Tax=Archangium lansingense TaxID=2995310 RepID=UPI003B8290DF